MLLFKSEITNAELKVASGEKVWGYEMQCDLENVHVYKKLLEDVGKRSGTLQSLILRLICMRSAWTIIYNLVRPKKELVKEEEVSQEPFVALTSEEEDEVDRVGSWLSTREKFQCLIPTEWLNEVINLYLTLLKEKEQREPQKFLKCHVFNTFLYKKVVRKVMISNLTKDGQAKRLIDGMAPSYNKGSLANLETSTNARHNRVGESPIIIPWQMVYFQ
ncbi:Ubiquitin-like-specific protease ESD4 [Glycine max]|nr:Ubiquitin-like-specific protease ESD4 [Glycine max]